MRVNRGGTDLASPIVYSTELGDSGIYWGIEDDFCIISIRDGEGRKANVCILPVGGLKNSSFASRFSHYFALRL